MIGRASIITLMGCEILAGLCVDFGDQESIGTGHPALIPTGPHLKAQQLWQDVLVRADLCVLWLYPPHGVYRAQQVGFSCTVMFGAGSIPPASTRILAFAWLPSAHPMGLNLLKAEGVCP